MSSLAVLSIALCVAFVALATWTTVQWLRRRTRATAYLAVAFVSLAAAIAADRLDALTSFDIPWPVIVELLNVILAAFPWLLAASVWTLDGHRPRWSWIGIVGVPGVSLWLLFAPLSGTPPHPLEPLLLLGTFVVLWTVAAVGTAVHLRRVAGRYVLARPRMRLMSVGLIVINLGLVLDVVAGLSGSETLQLAMNAVALIAAVAFLLGFLAPRPLRWWWRGASMSAFQQMQSELIAALSRHDVAEAVAPPLASLLGGGVVVVDEHGDVLDRAGIDEPRAARVAEHVLTGQPLDQSIQSASIGSGWLVVIPNAYTPLFGQDEIDLLHAYATHMRIALERAQMFEAIATQQQDLEAMLLGLAHDIRSPTAVISGFAELQVDTDDRDERRELADHIAGSTAYLDRLVDAMMELGEVRSTYHERDTVELGELARLVAERIRAAHPSVRVEVSSDGAAVVMSPVRAEQLFDNLLGNAVKHGGRENLTVTVELTAHGREYVEIVIADDGVGIDAADRHRIFTPFQRGSGARGVGSGLGLGLVTRIVEELDGRLTLEPSDSGARFVVCLPTGIGRTGQPAVAVEPHAS